MWSWSVRGGDGDEGERWEWEWERKRCERVLMFTISGDTNAKASTAWETFYKCLCHRIYIILKPLPQRINRQGNCTNYHWMFHEWILACVHRIIPCSCSLKPKISFNQEGIYANRKMCYNAFNCICRGTAVNRPPVPADGTNILIHTSTCTCTHRHTDTHYQQKCTYAFRTVNLDLVQL